MAINYKKLVEGMKIDANKAKAGFVEAVKAKQIKPSEIDLSKAWADIFGAERFHEHRYNPNLSVQKTMEAAGAVSSDAFLTITQQFVYSSVLDAYSAPELIFSNMIPTRSSPFRVEKIPGVTNIGDEATVVNEGDEFPLAGVSEDYVETPETVKRGMRIPITKEAIFFDRTGLVAQRCAEIGTWLGVHKEKRAVDCVTDLNTTAHRYRWRGVSTNTAVTQIATYGDNSGDHTWDNLAASNALTDYESLNTAWQLLRGMKDPFTDEPLGDFLTPKHIIFPPTLAFKAPFTVGGEVRKANPGFASSGNPSVTTIQNPVAKIIGNLELVSSQLLQSRQVAASEPTTTWYMGDITKAFAYIENWPLAVLSMGAGSHDEFTRDIVQQFRVSERGAYATMQPRAIVKCTA